jgi:phage pi2 protein 07
LECPVEKPLVFAHSPYQTEQILGDEVSHTFTGNDIFYLRKVEKTELYRNTVRLKVNMPVSLARQEIWHYDESPVFYDEFLQAHYPFKYPLVREIEAGLYEARYRVKDESGKERNVIYADEIDKQGEAESRLEYDGGPFSYSQYDVTTNHDKAILTLRKENDGDLYKAAIYGRPIVLDINRSCFIRDLEAVASCGTVALNVTGYYFSDYPIQRGNISVAQHEDWVMRELEERLQNRREFTVKTHRALFHARVGAKVKIETRNEELEGVINAFSFRYRKDKAFIAAFRIREQ